MRLNIKSTNLVVTPSLQEFIETKLGRLQKIVQKMEKNQELLLRVEVGRTTKHHKKGEVFRAEANLDIGKNVLRAESEHEDIHVAINDVYHELEREVTKFKEKLQPSKQKR